jgi:hypothetical protein
MHSIVFVFNKIIYYLLAICAFFHTKYKFIEINLSYLVTYLYKKLILENSRNSLNTTLGL